MTVSRNEVRAGLLVLVSLFVLGGGLLVLVGSGRLFGGQRTVVAVLADARGVRDGDPVRFAGLEVGEVDGLRVRSEFTPVRVEALLLVPEDLAIPKDSAIRVIETLTGSRLVEILPGSGEPLGTSEELTNDVTPPGLMELSGTASGIAGKIETALGEAADLLSRVDAVARQVQEAVEGGQVTSILANLDQAATDIAAAVRGLREDVEEILPVAKEAVEEFRDTGRQASDLLEGATPEVERILERVRTAAEGIAKLTDGEEAPVAKVLARIDGTVEDLAGLIGEFETTGREAGELVAESRPRVAAILDRLRTTGTNLKAASEDLRAHPWKLLNAPDVEDQRVQQLFSAARNFNSGAETLSDAVRELRATLARKGADAPDVEAQLERIARSFADYERAEKRFWEVLGSK